MIQLRSIYLFIILLFLSIHVIGQPAVHVVRLTGDSLLLSSGQAILEGQYLIIGKGKYENGWYHYISFKNFLNLPLLINREAELKYQYTGSSNPEQDRENDLVVSLLEASDSLVVKKIRYTDNKRYGKWYSMTLVNKSLPKTHFYANADSALKYNELIVP